MLRSITKFNQRKPRRTFEFKSCCIIHISSHFETGKVRNKIKAEKLQGI